MDDPYRPPKAREDAPEPGRFPKTRAQRAFDRCMVTMLAVLPATFLVHWLQTTAGRFVVVAVLGALWGRSLVGVLASWRDSDARVLRFSALGLLAFAALAGAGLWGMMG